MPGVVFAASSVSDQNEYFVLSLRSPVSVLRTGAQVIATENVRLKMAKALHTLSRAVFLHYAICLIQSVLFRLSTPLSSLLMHTIIERRNAGGHRENRGLSHLVRPYFCCWHMEIVCTRIFCF